MQGTALGLFRARTTLITLTLICCSLLMKAQTLPPIPNVAAAAPIPAQNAPKSIALTGKSDVPAKDILKALEKECPNVSITNDFTKSDYLVEAIKGMADPKSGEQEGFDLTLFDRDGKTIRTTSTLRLGNAVKDLCQAMKTNVLVEVVDTQNLTQSVDARGTGNPATLAGAITNATGRRTLTDTTTIAVVVNGEHALLDCFERRKGCITVGPGKYYGELDFGSVHGVGGIWIQIEMPLTHQQFREHYKIAGIRKRVETHPHRCVGGRRTHPPAADSPALLSAPQRSSVLRQSPQARHGS